MAERLTYEELQQKVEALEEQVLERKRVEKEIGGLNEELALRVIEQTAQVRALNRELEDFVYSVSHDLRRPLRAINGLSQALLEDCEQQLDARGRDYLHRIRASTQSMGQLIDDLLRLSRVMQGAMRIEAVDLTLLAREIAEEFQDKEPERRVEFSITPGLSVKGDASLLRIMVANLLGNAWKYTSRRSDARIEFSVLESSGQAGADQDREAVFFVRDNGIGFDMSYAGKLFRAFHRLHTADEFPGAGIGLATVQRVVHCHGGRLWAEGAVEKGATVYFTLSGPERR